MEEKIPTIKVIKKEAVVEIKVGTNIIEQLQKLTFFITQDLKEEDIELYKQEMLSYDKIITKQTDFSKEWMHYITTLTFLLKEIEEKAEKQGFVEEVNFEDYMKSIENSFNQEEN